jgi:hypothetical protein
MKKKVILICLSLLAASFLPFQSKAQDQRERTDPRFGIKGGVNFTNFYTNDESQADMLTGFNLGVFGKVPLASFIAIQPEFYFSRKGAEVTYNSLIVDGTARFALNYLELPILLVVNLTRNFNIQAGAFGSYLINGNVTNQSGINLFNFEQNIDSKDYNRFEAGLVAGAGIDIGSLSIGARYYYGLTNVGKERTFMGISYTVPDAKNGVFNVYVAISIN